MRYYRFSIFVSVLIALAVFFKLGTHSLITLGVVAVVEVAFSFDNAVVNVKVLERLSSFWVRMFLYFGIFIAVGGMRLAFPILIVMLTAGLGFNEVVTLALSSPQEYAAKLNEAHGLIAIFAGTFLLMLFLNWCFEEREITWLGPIERRLAKVGKVDMLAPIIALGSVLFISNRIHEHQSGLLVSGVLSVVVYMVVNSAANVFDVEDDEKEGERPVRTGAAALGLFVYLEVQDAAFSFDGVSGAFAITDDVKLIAAGLGIGALIVRSMTIHFLDTGQLAKLRYLEHGAHWAIGALAICLLLETHFEISEWVTGGIGMFFIVIAWLHSLHSNRRDAKARQLVSVR